MLVLGRKKDERVFITCPNGTRITVIVCRHNNDRCEIGFDAPDDVKIDREEVADIKREGDAV